MLNDLDIDILKSSLSIGDYSRLIIAVKLS